MDVGRTPGVGMVKPGVCSWTNRQETIDPIFICQTPAHAQEVGIERPRPLITFVEIPASGIGLPDLQERIWSRISTVVENAPGHNDALPDRLAANPRVACEIGVFRRDDADDRAWSR